MKFYEYSIIIKIILTIILFPLFIKCEEEENGICSQCIFSKGGSEGTIYKCICPSSTESCNCNQKKCRPHLYNDNKCYDCSILQIYNLNLYSILEEEHHCSIVPEISECNKITYEYNECVNDCGTGFELKDYCFKECYSNLGLEEDDENINSSTKKCKCKNYYIEIDINGKKFAKCVDKCPNYYNVITKECLDKCEGTFSRITKDKGCTEQCSDIEFLYISNAINEEEETKYYCLDKCPDDARFYYEKKLSEKEITCKKQCYEHDFFTIKDGYYICSSDCNKQALIDLSNNILQCTDKEKNSPCPDIYLYQYQGSCFRNCSDTKYLSYFGNTVTYFYNYHDKKICSEKCEEYYSENSETKKDIKYIDQYNLSCVDCKTTNFKYSFGIYCLNTCYTENGEHPNHIYDTGECFFNCPDGYLLLRENKTCFHKCPSFSDKIFRDETNKECYTCNIPKAKNPNYGEGYFIKNTEINVCKIADNFEKKYFPDDNGNLRCLKSCPEENPCADEGNEHGTYKFHKNNDNECMFGISCDTIEGNTYKYHSIENINICYKSCKDIPGNFKYEHNFECSNLPCSGYYYNYSGIFKCIDEIELLGTCTSNGLYYVMTNKECIKDCNKEQYKIPYKIENEKIIELGKCLSLNEFTADSDLISKCYYSFTEKICHSECPYRIVKKSSESTDIEESSEGNCVINCPFDYPYEFEEENKQYCLKECDNYYVNKTGILKCVSNCKSISKYFINGVEQCIDKCEKDINGKKYYYYNENNECLKLCKDQTAENALTFSLKAETSPQPCIKECPALFPFYYDDEKICLSDCNNTRNGFIKEKGNNECVSKCPKYIMNGNICSEKCPDDEPFVYELSISGSTIKKCTSNCQKENAIFKYYKYDKIEKIYNCRSFCDLNEKQYGNQCLDDCPAGLYEESNECISKCSNKPYYQKNNKGVYECKDNCFLIDANDLIINDEQDKPKKGFISSTQECLNNCPLGENFIGAGNKCKSFCEPLTDGEYYRKIANITISSSSSYIIYECTKQCKNTEKHVDGTKECITDCPENKPFYNSNDNTCYSLCSKSEYYSYSYSYEDEKKCLPSCPDGKKNYQNDKICVDGCTGLNNIINDKDSSCVNKCDINSSHKYLKTKKLTDGKLERHCVDSCTKYTSNDYICYNNYDDNDDICPEPYNFINGVVCDNKCQDKKFAYPKDDNESPKEYICQNSCEDLYYYEKDKICIKACKDYNIEYTKKCVESCDDISTPDKPYYFYETRTSKLCVEKCKDKPFIDKDNKCTEICNENTPYYIPGENKCKLECPDGYVKIENEYECLLKCPQDQEDGFKFEDETKTCVKSCKSSKAGYYYYYESDKKCLKGCNISDYIYNDYICVSSCHQDKPYIYNKKCIDICPSDQRYYIGIFEHGETDLRIFCLTDCPQDYPFYNLKEDGSAECLGSCQYFYISNKDPIIIGKECISKCNDIYPYYVKYNNTHKECFEICPNEKPFYVIYENLDKECLEKCPLDNPYHEKNSYECKRTCNSKYAKYKEKECLSNCEIDNYWIKEENNDITLCVNNCSEIEYAHFSTPDRECVVECDGRKFLRGNRKNGLCECINLFYYNEFGVEICFDNNIKNCGEKGTDSEDYPFQINGENQCVQNCFGVLSPSEDICYLGDFKCPENTEKGIYDGKIKCDCKYKYYFDAKQKKICLNENDQCPNGYSYLIPEKKECVQNCNKYEGYTLVFDNKCFKECPNDMKKTQDEKSCECSYNWYKESENKYICLETCPSDFPCLIQDTNECVQKCNKTNYNIYYNGTCISSCTGNMKKVEIPQDYPTYSFSKYTCRCKNVWTEGKCAISSEDTCNALEDNELKYLVRETKECVKNCPDYYKYYFNEECFLSCKDAEKYGYNLKVKNNSNECECNNYWKIEDNKKICVDKCEYDEITIEEIKQCSKPDDLNNFACPYNSPYFYNNICFVNCPNGTSIDNTKGNTCKCDDLWFRQGNLIYCPKEKLENCPYNTHPYLIVTTKECVTHKENCSDYKIFNYKCYNQCPYLTKANNNNDCECDKNYFWYKYKNSSELRDYFECGLKNCTEERPYYINGTNECIKRCGDEELYEYGNICYKECPVFTQKNKKAYICEFSTESNDLQNLVGNVTNRIVDIYDDLPIGGLVINNEEASLQIYGLKKSDTNNKENKGSIMRSNLAYLDLSGCIDKIYESNDMDSKDDIVVVKLDLKSKNSKLIVNPIEYEFVNSRNGKVLDASVCERNEVVISYPITYMLNNKNKLRNLEDDEGNENLNEEEEKNVDENEENIKKDILNKFNKGKELNNIDKSIDTFNFNNSIYSDICISVEIEGKDLVLENRIQYLFPNYSFCESVCTYDYTDFEGERIYCNCSIKSGIDTDRPHSVKIYQFNKNETDNYQKGPTNVPVLKCVSKAKISGNAAFFFCLVFIIIEVGLLLTVIFYGISSLINKIKEKIIDEKDEDKNNNEYNSTENEKIKENKIDKTLKYRNTNSNTSSTKRKIRPIEIKNVANPPKNENGVEEEEDEKNKDGVINIKKLKNRSYKLKEKDLKIDEKNNFDVFSDAVESEVNKYLRKNEIETQTGFFQSMKKEEKFLRTKYNYSLQNDKHDSIIVVLTSIFDKIYIIKILLLSGKFEIIPLMFSLYLLCHMLLLTFVTFFYDIKTIKKIYENENFPNTNYYLSYGFTANLIVWIIFKLFACLLGNDHKVKKVNNINNLSKKNEKLKKIIYEIKRNMIIYFVFQFLLIIFCSFYLITFCGIYLGTKQKIFQSYGIAVIEIVIIKIVYGFILGVLRKISLYKEIKILYDIVLILNKYIA